MVTTSEKPCSRNTKDEEIKAYHYKKYTTKEGCRKGRKQQENLKTSRTQLTKWQ